MATLAEPLPYDLAADRQARDRLAVHVLRAALVLGLLGDLLLRGGGLGVNMLLLSLLAVAMVHQLDRERGDGATQARLALLVPALAAGVAMAWRDNFALTACALLWAIISAALHAQSLRAGPEWSLWRLDVAAPLAAAAQLLRDGVGQAGFLLARDVPAHVTSGSARFRSLASAWRGVLVAVPLLLVMNALLMSADPIWEKQAKRVLDIEFGQLLGHVALAALLAWTAGGWLRGALLAPTPPASTAQPNARTIRGLDVMLPLVLVNVLFAGFVALQLRTLAGGAEYVRAASGLTFAEYARRGFFELLTVAGLMLPALLGADALTPLDHRARRDFKRLAWVTLLLLAGILAAAAGRMALYTTEYGLTEDRFFASAIMVWMGGVLAWFGATVLRDRRERFVGGALVSAFGVWAALVVANPEAIIVRENVARGAARNEVDVDHLNTLGRDAVPAIVASLPRLHPWDACAVRFNLGWERRRLEAGDRDWRSWSVARWRAQSAMQGASIAATPDNYLGNRCGADPRPASRLRPESVRVVPTTTPAAATETTPAAPPATRPSAPPAPARTLAP